MYLVTLPLSTVRPDSPQYASYLAAIFSVILTIPLFLNRLQPLDHLSKFLSRLSLSTVSVLDPYITPIVQSSDVEPRIHLASIIYMFYPEYKGLPPPALSTYLQLSAFSLSNFPTNFVLGSPRTQGASTKMTKPTATWKKDSNSDSDDGFSTRVTVVDKFTTTPLTPVLFHRLGG